MALASRTHDIARAAALFSVVAAIFYVVVCQRDVLRVFTPAGASAAFSRLDAHVRSAGSFGPALYVAVITLGVQAFPATPICIGAVILFGKSVGSIVNLAGCLLGCFLSFVLGRYFFRGYARKLVIRGRLSNMDRQAEKHGFFLILYLRLLWFPYIVLNYGAGVTRIRFRDYATASLIGLAIPVFLVSYLVGGIGEMVRSFRSASDLADLNVLIPLGLLLFSFTIPSLIKRYIPGIAGSARRNEEEPSPATGV